MRELRDTTAWKLKQLSCRTLRSELLLIPLPKLTEIIGGVIAHYQAMYGIQILAIIVLSDHYHILARGPEGTIPEFFACVNREITHRVNRYLGRAGPLWSRRYDDLGVLEVPDVVEAVLYTVTNNVKHGLARHPKHWPGICSYWQSLGGKNKTYRFCNYTAYNRAKRRAERRGEYVSKAAFERECTLEITPISEVPNISEQVVESLPRLIEERVAWLVEKRTAAGQGFISRKDILSQPLQGRFPRETNRTKRPICYTRSPVALQAFAQERRLLRAAYRDASVAFRSGRYDVPFPPHTLKPPLHYVPKEARHPT